MPSQPPPPPPSVPKKLGFYTTETCRESFRVRWGLAQYQPEIYNMHFNNQNNTLLLLLLLSQRKQHFLLRRRLLRSLKLHTSVFTD